MALSLVSFVWEALLFLVLLLQLVWLKMREYFGRFFCLTTVKTWYLYYISDLFESFSAFS